MYEPRERTKRQVYHAFTYHPPHGNQTTRYEGIRGAASILAGALMSACPESRELSLALTNLEQAVMWANAAIARNETPPVPGPPNPPRPERPNQFA
jgi:hypothetical protein